MDWLLERVGDFAFVVAATVGAFLVLGLCAEGVVFLGTRAARRRGARRW